MMQKTFALTGKVVRKLLESLTFKQNPNAFPVNLTGKAFIILCEGVLFYAVLIFAIEVAVEIAGIDIRGTLATEYLDTDNLNEQLIRTYFFEMRTPKNWIHVYGGHYQHGTPYGIFITGKGQIHYDYGIYSPSYHSENPYFKPLPLGEGATESDSLLYIEIDERFHYQFKQLRSGRFTVDCATNRKGETSISFGNEHEVVLQMAFYMDDAVTRNFDELIKAINSFRLTRRGAKLYNLNPGPLFEPPNQFY